MANEQNLRPGEYKLTVEEQKKGGRASGEARRRKRDLRLVCQTLLEMDIKGKNGEVKSGAEAIALKQLEKALKGDTKAFAVLRDTAGQTVTQKIVIAEVDNSVIQEVEDIVLNNNDE